jgi:hypothetical protein
MSCLPVALALLLAPQAVPTTDASPGEPRGENAALSEQRAEMKRPEVPNPYLVHRHTAMWSLLGAWTSTVLGSLAYRDSFFLTTALPVAGPFISYVRISSGGGRFLPAGDVLLLLSGIVQSGLLAYLVGAVVGELSFEPEVLLAPGPTTLGGTLRFRF